MLSTSLRDKNTAAVAEAARNRGEDIHDMPARVRPAQDDAAVRIL
jgi:hypothetical protein